MSSTFNFLFFYFKIMKLLLNLFFCTFYRSTFYYHSCELYKKKNRLIISIFFEDVAISIFRGIPCIYYIRLLPCYIKTSTMILLYDALAYRLFLNNISVFEIKRVLRLKAVDVFLHVYKKKTNSNPVLGMSTYSMYLH